MNPGDSVQDVSRAGPDEASGLGAVGHGASGHGAADHGASGHGGGMPPLSARSTRPLQDIQDIIDKLAVVTQQLRRPGSSVAGPSN